MQTHLERIYNLRSHYFKRRTSCCISDVFIYSIIHRRPPRVHITKSASRTFFHFNIFYFISKKEKKVLFLFRLFVFFWFTSFIIERRREMMRTKKSVDGVKSEICLNHHLCKAYLVCSTRIHHNLLLCGGRASARAF